jgi:DNA-binding MarR family transcriptional regulator
MDTALAVTRLVRAEVRRRRPSRLSLSELRSLGFLEASPHASLSALAADLGLTLPATSILVDRLVRRGLVGRRTAPLDRRRVMLRLTATGRARLRAARTLARAALTARLRALSPPERAAVGRAMALLHPFVLPAAGRTPARRGG